MTNVETIRRVLNRMDPLGLIADGAPEDEYNPETSVLAELPIEEVSAARVYRIFSDFFWIGAVSLEDAALIAAMIRHPSNLCK